MNIFTLFANYAMIIDSHMEGEKSSKYNELSISYAKKGEGDNVLVFLHGWGLSKKTWANIVKYFPEKNFTLLLIDLPGFGKSSNIKKSYSLDDYAGSVYSLIEKMGFLNFTLIGHSFGGKVAVDFVFKYPELVNKLILCDTNLNNRSGVLSRTVELLLTFRQPKILKEIFRKTHYNIDFDTMLLKIYIPTLLIYGKLDLITPLNIAYKIKPLIKNSRIEVFSKSGHLPYIEEENKFCNKIKEFVKN